MYPFWFRRCVFTVYIFVNKLFREPKIHSEKEQRKTNKNNSADTIMPHRNPEHPPHEQPTNHLSANGNPATTQQIWERFGIGANVIMSAATIAVIIVAISQSKIAEKSADAATASVQIAKQSVMYDLRPYIAVKFDSMYVFPDSVIMSWTFTNTGKTPAYNVGQAGIFQCGKLISSQYMADCVPDPGSLDVGGGISYPMSYSGKCSKSFVDSVKSGYHVWVAIVLQYTDTFDSIHRSYAQVQILEHGNKPEPTPDDN